jgi:RNA polymerase sigma-70 factor (ECF subfamily)
VTIRDWTDTEPKRLNAVEAFEELTPNRLVELYADDVWRFVSSKLRRREDAEDVAMETFSAAIKDFDRIRKAGSPRLWILGIARNKVGDAMRRAYRRAEDPLDESLRAPDADTSRRESLHQAMAELPELHREILVLKYINGLSTDEVAKVIRKSAAATNSLLQRARQSLRERAQPLIEAQGGTR